MVCHEPGHFARDCPLAAKGPGKGGRAEPARAATVLMEPELCAATHHVIYEVEEDCFSETSLDCPDFWKPSFKTGFWKETVVARDQGFDVDQGLRDEGLSLSLSMSATTATAEHTTSTPPGHAMLHHVFRCASRWRGGSELPLGSTQELLCISVREHVFQWCC